MTQQDKNLFREEKLALNNYAEERRKTSNDLHFHIKQILCREKIAGSFIFGLLLGAFFGGINFGIGALKIKKLDKNDLIKTSIQHKQLEKKRTFSTMMLVDFFVLIILSVGIEDCRDVLSQNFHNMATKLSCNYFKQIFGQEKCTKETADRAKHAAALIINNMPKEKLEYMRALAIAGLSCDIDGRFKISIAAIEAAQTIISEHLDANPEIQNAVNQIMNDKKIKTYVLNVVNQRMK